MTTLDARMGAAQFGTHFDEALARALPAIFTLDADGELRLNLDRSREAWDRLAAAGAPAPTFDEAHALLRDRATGWVLYARAGAWALLADHPRADVRRFPDEAAARAALAALGRPPVVDAAAWAALGGPAEASGRAAVPAPPA
jgi:hypothetical protein